MKVVTAAVVSTVQKLDQDAEVDENTQNLPEILDSLSFVTIIEDKNIVFYVHSLEQLSGCFEGG